ncbi:MAG TPA: hypothetical protein VFA11_05945 [Acidimicrobiales bacterium]|nr:hypothetical protein [Acidimicrobiales bacterium]
MVVSLVAFGLGAVISLSTSWVLVARLERLGERLGLSEALLGLVAALAADTPEITSAVTALAHHEHSVGAGVVLGSNVFNLAALLGLAAVAAGRIRLHRRVVVLDGAVALWVGAICVGSVGGPIGPAPALGLCLLVLIPYAVVLGGGAGALRRVGLSDRTVSWLGRAVAEEESELLQAIRPRRGSAGDAAVAGICLLVVVSASAAMERAASSLGHRWSVPGIIVGGVVLAAVTSLPNAVAGFYLGTRGRGAALLSTTLNSNTLNVVAGLLLPATITGLAAGSGSGLLVAAWYGGLTSVVLVMAWSGHGLGRVEGWTIIAGYAGFLAVLLAVAG